MSSLSRALSLPVLLLFAPLVGCDTEGVDPVPFDPSTVDYDQVASTDFGDYVQPLLAARNIFAASAGTTAGALSDYTWAAIFAGAGGETIVPFDEEGSFLVRFLEDLPADATLPFPNLRRLEADELRFVKRWIAAGARSDDGAVPYATAEHVLYAAEQAGEANSVALIDMMSHRVIRRVYFDDLGVPAGTYGPHHMVFEPDGSAWYVSLVNGGDDSAGRVLKLSTDLTLDPGAPAYLLAQSPSFRTPGMMAVNPNTNQLFVGRSTLSQTGTPGIGVFDRATMTLIEEVATPFDIPHALGITTDGAYVMTAALTGNQMATIRTSDYEFIMVPLEGPARELIHFGVHPAQHAAAAGEHAAHGSASSLHLAEVTLTSRSTDEVLFMRLEEDGSLTVVGDPVIVGDGPYHAHLGADGHTLLVPNQFGNSVSMVDVPTRTVTRTVENPSGGPLARPHSPAPGMDGSVFFVTSSNWPPGATWEPTYRFLSGDPGDTTRTPLPNEAFGNVSVFNAETGALVKVIQVRAYPAGLEHPMVHHH